MVDQTLARYVNELSILTVLRTQGPASRADMARRLSVTPATITRLIAEMTHRELVREIATPVQNTVTREPGRPGVSVALNPHGAYFLGVEIGHRVLRYALLDLSASIVASSEEVIPKRFTPKAAVKAIAGHVAKLEKDVRFHGRIRSGGVTVPGLVTSEGFIVYLPSLRWKEVNLLAMLGEAIQLPCIVENDANAAAFGSVYTQPSLPSVCTIFLKLGSGLGGAVIINGRLLRGATGTAGEIGHMRMTDHGHRCSCGQIGCLETWVNEAALARSFRGADSLSEVEFASLPAEVAQAANAGDTHAKTAIKSVSRYLGLSIVTLVNIFNPTTIMFGGRMLPVIAQCLEAIRTQVAAGIVPGTTVPEMRLSSLGIFECAIGAATIAHHHAFDISKVDLFGHRLGP